MSRITNEKQHALTMIKICGELCYGLKNYLNIARTSGRFRRCSSRGDRASLFSGAGKVAGSSPASVTSTSVRALLR